MQSPIKMLTAFCNLLGDCGGRSHPTCCMDVRAQWASLPPLHLHKGHSNLSGECKGNKRSSRLADSVAKRSA